MEDIEVQYWFFMEDIEVQYWLFYVVLVWRKLLN